MDPACRCRDLPHQRGVQLCPDGPDEFYRAEGCGGPARRALSEDPDPVARLLHKEPDRASDVPNHQRRGIHSRGRIGGGDSPPQGFLHSRLSGLRHLLPRLAAGHHRHARLPASRLSHRHVRQEDASDCIADSGHSRKPDHPPPGDDFGNKDCQGL